MGKVKNYFHDEIQAQEDDGVYPCTRCRQPIVRGDLCEKCGKLSTIEKAASRLPNMLNEQRKFHQTKAPWGKKL